MPQEEYNRAEGYRRAFDFCIHVERLFKTLLKERPNRHFHLGVFAGIRDFLKDKDRQLEIRKVDRELILKRINERQQEKTHLLER